MKNPWDVNRIPGGSSGGSGAAVAAGLCYAALGTDTGGSIRIPSALCGIVGLKPTFGRVSKYGVVPLADSLDHIGPMARGVEDLAILLEAIAGFDKNDSATVNQNVPNYCLIMDKGIKGLKVGVPTNYFFNDLEPEVEKSMKVAIQQLAALDAEIIEVTIPELERAEFTGLITTRAEVAAYHQDTLEESPNCTAMMYGQY